MGGGDKYIVDLVGLEVVGPVVVEDLEGLVEVEEVELGDLGMVVELAPDVALGAGEHLAHVLGHELARLQPFVAHQAPHHHRALALLLPELLHHKVLVLVGRRADLILENMLAAPASQEKVRFLARHLLADDLLAFVPRLNGLSVQLHRLVDYIPDLGRLDALLRVNERRQAYVVDRVVDLDRQVLRHQRE